MGAAHLVRGALVSLLVVASAAGCGTVPVDIGVVQSDGAPVRPHLAVGHKAWVTVSVARLWKSPSSPRAVDAPALAAPVRFRAWLSAMSLDDRLGLSAVSPTEVLLGDRVNVVRLRAHWAKVVVPSQPSQLDPRGYPGWVPRRQLTARPQLGTSEVATVTRRTGWLRTDDGAATKRTEVSIGTNLAVLSAGRGWVHVLTPRGVHRVVSTRVVTVHQRGTPTITSSRAGLVSTAKRFLGLDYLWGGLSGFGMDCSGLTWLDYRLHGIRIPRDALPQSRRGQRVGHLHKADLLFYGSPVHHVTMYVGGGWMIQAPHTGAQVRLDPVSSMSGEYVGARRYS